jgi:hypothetical protein
MVDAYTTQDRNARRLLITVAIAAAAILIVTMAVAAFRTRVSEFDPKQWTAGANQFTATNPRSRMAGDVIRRIQQNHASEVLLVKMLGNPDPDFDFTIKGRSWPGAGSGGGTYMYVLGTRSPRMFQPRCVEVLYVGVPTKGVGALWAYVTEVAYPNGATINSKPGTGLPWKTPPSVLRFGAAPSVAARSATPIRTTRSKAKPARP